jgi:hypothetical protein
MRHTVASGIPVSVGVRHYKMDASGDTVGSGDLPQCVPEPMLRRDERAEVYVLGDGLSVRIVRWGPGHDSPFSPGMGYRYDGLFRAESYWHERGQGGFLVCRYRLVADQIGDLAGSTDAAAGAPARRAVTNVQRIVRDTALGREVKRLHDHCCQVCGI